MNHFSRALMFVLLFAASQTHAVIMNVNEFNDELNNDLDCSLREAIRSANTDKQVDGCPAGSGADTINLKTGTFTLLLEGAYENAAMTGDLDITSDITIIGAFPDRPTIQACTVSTIRTGTGAAECKFNGGTGITDRIFEMIRGGRLSIKDVILRNGISENGAAIFSDGTLNVTRCVFTGNHVTRLSLAIDPGEMQGGAIFGTALNIDLSEFNGNLARRGGAVASSFNLTITRSEFTGNNAIDKGGAIYFHGFGGSANLNSLSITGNQADNSSGGIDNVGTMKLSNSTLSGNRSLDQGGAFSNTGTFELTNCTVSGNRASFLGVIFNQGKLTVRHSTISDNNSGGPGGIQNDKGSVTLHNTIIANSVSTSGDYCGPLDAASSNNIIEDGFCEGNIPELPRGPDPLLAPLGDNGGPTRTHALLSGSPAIDKANGNICNAAPVNNIDQRTAERPLDGDGDGFADCDIGAYELRRGFGAPPGRALRVPIDIQFCRNPNEFSCDQSGVVPILIFGNETVNVNEIDIASVRLCLATDPDQCISAIDAAFPVDRGNSFEDLGANQCSNTGSVLQGKPDGFEDIDVLFQAQGSDGVAALIGCPVKNRKTISSGLIIKGKLNDGTRFLSAPIDDIGIDRLVILKGNQRTEDNPRTEPK